MCTLDGGNERRDGGGSGPHRDGKQSPGNEGSGRDGKDEVGLSPKELSGKSRIVLQCEMSLTGSCV